MGVQAQPQATHNEAAALVDALAIAFNTYLLYPDPIPQLPFQRSMQAIRGLDLPIEVEIGAGQFWLDHEPLDTEREGADRLATRLFLHDIGRLRIVAPPHPSDLVQLFNYIVRDEEEVKEEGGVGVLLAEEGIVSLKLEHRMVGLSEEGLDDGEGHERWRDPAVVEILEEIGSPDRLAAQVDPGEPSEAAASFLDWYREVYERLADDDINGREQVVQMFVESFFYLEFDVRPEVVEQLLDDRNEEASRLFLDQFSGHDLLEMAQRISEEHLTLLMDYARIATDAADSRPSELFGLLQSAKEVKQAHRAVVERVQDLLGPEADRKQVESEAFAVLKARAPSADSFFGTGLRVLRGLVAVEDREPRLRRVLRIWAGKIASSVRGGDLETAVAWYKAIVEDPPYPKRFQPDVDEALSVLTRHELITVINDLLADPAHEAHAVDFVEHWGPVAVPELVVALTDEDDQAKRRRLIDLLILVTSIDPRPMIAVDADHPWFLARNVASILGKSGRPEVGPRLRELIDHDEARVRVEAIRALIPLIETASSNLSAVMGRLRDSEERVRSAALVALQGVPGDVVDRRFAELIHELDDFAEQKRVIGVLAGRDSPVAQRTLQTLAKRRFLWRRDERALRRAAREALWRQR